MTMLALASFAGCTTTGESVSYPAPSDIIESGDTHVGQKVVWGGTIARIRNDPESTLLEVVARPLDSRGRPRRTDTSIGRFKAFVNGFLDPVVYANGRRITVTGTISDLEPGLIGDYPYRYPVVNADKVTLWEESPQPVNAPYYYGPWYGPHGWYPYRGYPWFGGPAWYGW